METNNFTKQKMELMQFHFIYISITSQENFHPHLYTLFYFCLSGFYFTFLFHCSIELRHCFQSVMDVPRILSIPLFQHLPCKLRYKSMNPWLYLFLFLFQWILFHFFLYRITSLLSVFDGCTQSLICAFVSVSTM